MTVTEFHAAVGRLTRQQGWSLDSIATLALEFIATNQTRRQQFVRLLKRVAAEENAGAEAEVSESTEHHG